MIKNYLELNEAEMVKFIEFESRTKNNKLSIEEMDKIFKTSEFDFGKGTLIKIRKNEVLGRILVVLKECDKKGIAYIVRLEIAEGDVVEDRVSLVLELMESAKSLSRKYAAQKIFLGTGNSEIISALNAQGIKKQYTMLLMKLEDRQVRNEMLNIVELSLENKEDYLRIYNDAFCNVPNAATLTKSEVEEYIENRSVSDNDSNNEYYYIAQHNSANIGFLHIKIENGIGEFDLGLAETARGKGLGKMLLETAINTLNSKGVDEIRLTVASSNTVAFEIYKKRGFEEIKKISDWFQLN